MAVVARAAGWDGRRRSRQRARVGPRASQPVSTSSAGGIEKVRAWLRTQPSRARWAGSAAAPVAAAAPPGSTYGGTPRGGAGPRRAAGARGPPPGLPGRRPPPGVGPPPLELAARHAERLEVVR